MQLHTGICVTVRFPTSSVCFHKARPYKALNVIVLSIDIGAWVSAQDCAAFLRAGCGLSPTKLEEGTVRGLEMVLTPSSVHHWVLQGRPTALVNV